MYGVAVLSPHQAWAPGHCPSSLCPEPALFEVHLLLVMFATKYILARIMVLLGIRPVGLRSCSRPTFQGLYLSLGSCWPWVASSLRTHLTGLVPQLGAACQGLALVDTCLQRAPREVTGGKGSPCAPKLVCSGQPCDVITRLLEWFLCLHQPCTVLKGQWGGT
jgi:hypothetical protein